MGDIQLLSAEIDRLGRVIAALTLRAEAAEAEAKDWRELAGRLAEALRVILHSAVALAEHDKLKKRMEGRDAT